MQHRYIFKVSYDGTAFNGSQIQVGVPTVQGALNEALSILLKQPIETFGASRTDEGVHAFSNMYHIDWEGELWKSFKYQLNALLPATMAIEGIYKAYQGDFNVRFDAISRSYEYQIYNQKNPFLLDRAYYFPFQIDKEVLHETAKILMEYEDFESFAKRKSQTYTHICKLYKSEWREENGLLIYHVTGSRFLRGMVRALVGTQLRIARGKGGIEDFRGIIEAKNCQLADFGVPGHGLYLKDIEFPADSFEEVIFDK